MKPLKSTLAASLLTLVSAALAATPSSVQKIQVGGNGNVFPESITSTRDGTVFTSSVGEGRVYRASPGADKATAWTAKQPGPHSVLGVYADEKSGTLWACYSDMAWTQGKQGQPAILRALDLSSGRVERSYPLPSGTFCNDIVTTDDGVAFVTDTHGGRIFRVEPGNQATTWLTDARLKGVDGIALKAPDTLYLTNVQKNELFRLAIAQDGRPGELVKLSLSEKVEAPDGLRRSSDGKFFLAENKAGRVDEVKFEGDTAKISVIRSGFQGPTSMTVTDGHLYVTEAKINQYGKGRNVGPFYVYEEPLPRD